MAASRNTKDDAIAMLIDDHDRVKKIFKAFEKLGDDGAEDEKQQLMDTACTELKIHAALEEEIFYPAALEATGDDAMLDEAEVEHASAKDLIAMIEDSDAGDSMTCARFTVLGEYINHHVEEEQNEMFPKVRKAKIDLAALGAQMQARKAELLEEFGVPADSAQLVAAASKSKPQAKRASRSA